MIRMRVMILALVALLATSATAANLNIVKTMTTISDPQGSTKPKAIPGATLDYTATVTNPTANTRTTVAGIQFVDALPAHTVLRVADLGVTGSGPVEFVDGSALGLGLLGSNLDFSFKGLSDDTDSVQFSSDNGANWTYHPVDGGDGYDTRVTNIRVQPTGNQASGSSFRIRFRVRLL